MLFISQPLYLFSNFFRWLNSVLLLGLLCLYVIYYSGWLFFVSTHLIFWYCLRTFYLPFISGLNLCIFVHYCISVVFCIMHSSPTFYFIVEIEKMARINDPIDSVSDSSVVHPEYSFVFVSSQYGVCWIPSIGNFIYLLYCNIWFDMFSILFLFYYS